MGPEHEDLLKQVTCLNPGLWKVHCNHTSGKPTRRVIGTRRGRGSLLHSKLSLRRLVNGLSRLEREIFKLLMANRLLTTLKPQVLIMYLLIITRVYLVTKEGGLGSSL